MLQDKLVLCVQHLMKRSRAIPLLRAKVDHRADDWDQFVGFPEAGEKLLSRQLDANFIAVCSNCAFVLLIWPSSFICLRGAVDAGIGHAHDGHCITEAHLKLAAKEDVHCLTVLH